MPSPPAGVVAPASAGAALPPPPAAPPSRPAARLRARDLGVAAVLFALVALILTLPVWADPAHDHVGVAGDPEQTMWELRWVPYALTHGLNPLTTTFVDWPSGVNLMWNSSIPIAGLLMTPVTLSLGPVAAYDVLMVAGFVASALAAFAAVRRYVPGLLPCLAGGLLYGFSPYVIHQALGHVNLATVVTPPLVLLLLDELAVRQRRAPWRTGVLLGLVLSGQLLFSEEVLATEVLIGGAGLVILALLHREQVASRLRSVAIGLAVAAAVGLAITAAPLAVQFLGPQRVHGAAQQPGVYVQDLLGFVVPSNLEAIAPARLAGVADGFSGNASEQGGYMGLPLLAIIGIQVWRRRRDPVVVACSALGVTVAVLSLGNHLHVRGVDRHVPLPWIVIEHVPLLDNLLPGRLTVYLWLLGAIVLGTFVQDVVERARNARAPALVGAALVVAAFAAVTPRAPLVHTSVVIPPFFTDGTAANSLPTGDVVLMAPFPGDFSTQSMLWHAEMGIRVHVPGGYWFVPDAAGHPNNAYDCSTTAHAMAAIQTGHEPPAKLGQLFDCPGTDLVLNTAPTGPLRDAVRADLRRWGVDDIIMGPMDAAPEMRSFLTGIVGRPAQDVDGVALWTDVRSAVGAA